MTHSQAISGVVILLGIYWNNKDKCFVPACLYSNSYIKFIINLQSISDGDGCLLKISDIMPKFMLTYSIQISGYFLVFYALGRFAWYLSMSLCSSLLKTICPCFFRDETPIKASTSMKRKSQNFLDEEKKAALDGFEMKEIKQADEVDPILAIENGQRPKGSGKRRNLTAGGRRRRSIEQEYKHGHSKKSKKVKAIKFEQDLEEEKDSEKKLKRKGTKKPKKENDDSGEDVDNIKEKKKSSKKGNSGESSNESNNAEVTIEMEGEIIETAIAIEPEELSNDPDEKKLKRKKSSKKDRREKDDEEGKRIKRKGSKKNRTEIEDSGEDIDVKKEKKKSSKKGNSGESNDETLDGANQDEKLENGDSNINQNIGENLEPSQITEKLNDEEIYPSFQNP
jgi:hypothetical protein